MISSMKGKRGLVFGAADQKSIAWAITESLTAAGAEVCLTCQNDKIREKIELLVKDRKEISLLVCDVTDKAQVESLIGQMTAKWGYLDYLVHSIAYAHWDDLRGEYINVDQDGFQMALTVSAYSLTNLARAARPLLAKAPEGAGIVTLTYIGSTRVMPGYNVMGVAKAALESSVRYLANDLGPENIRVNGISAGPLATRAARAVSSLSEVLEAVEQRSPLKRNIEASEVGDAALFLLSPLARGITGDTLFVDAGYHVLS